MSMQGALDGALIDGAKLHQALGSGLPPPVVDYRFAARGSTRDERSGIASAFLRSSAGWDFNAAFSLTEFANNTARFSHLLDGMSLGLRVELASTNEIRNSTMVGATTGTGSDYPDNWSANTEWTTIDDIIAVTTERGMEVIEVRLNGTPTGDLDIFFEGTAQVAATQNEVWASSFFSKLVAGDFTNIDNVKIIHEEYDSGPALLSTNIGSDIQSEITTSLARHSFVDTLDEATGATIRPGIRIAHTSGAIDITLRFYQPQCEEQPFVMSPIKTSTVAVTRAKDAFSAVLALGEQSWVISGKSAKGVMPGDQILWSHNASGAERMQVFRNTSGQLRLLVIAGGGAVADVFIGNLADDTDFTVAIRCATNDMTGSLNGAAVGTIDTSAAIPASMVTYRMGSDASSNGGWGGTISRVRIYDFGLTDLQLRQLSS